MREQPIRFSVVCAAYNAEATAVRAIASCLEQTHTPHEVIVVDDGSTDRTAAVIEDAFGERVRIIRLARNSGPSAARNAGLDAATGDFIALQDADDWWEPEKLARVAEVLASSEDVGFVFHRYALEHFTGVVVDTSVRKISHWQLLLRNVIATPCAVFRANNVLRFDERLRWMEDWDFFLRTEEHWGAWLLDESLTVLGRPVLSTGGQSSSRWKMRRAEMQVYANWAGRHWWRLPLLPLLWLWSAMKAFAKLAKATV